MAESSPSLIEKVETYAIVTVLAALIWLYAEDQNAKVYNNEPGQVRFVSPQGRELLIEPATAQEVRLSVRCTSGQLARLRKTLEEAPLDIVLTDNPARSDALEQVVLRDQLAKHERINAIGAAVTEVLPRTVSVRVERLERVVLPVAANVGDAALAGPPTLDPPQASIKVPASLVAGVEGLRFEVALRDVPNLATLATGVAHTAELPLSVPPELRLANTRPTPATARLTFTLGSQTDTLKLTTVPVDVRKPASAEGTFVVTLAEENQFLRDVELTGPNDAIAVIRRTGLRAILALSSEELEAGLKSKLPTLDLPSGVNVVSSILPVNLTITRLSTPSPAPPAPAP